MELKEEFPNKSKGLMPSGSTLKIVEDNQTERTKIAKLFKHFNFIATREVTFVDILKI